MNTRAWFFIGPSSEAITAFSDKAQARRLCEKAGVPLLPSHTKTCKKEADWLKAGEAIGYPLIVKALNGGGGRGLKIVHSAEELIKAVSIVKQEAKKHFHNEEVFLEKYLEGAKHIEIQIFTDATGQVFVLGDRDCSLQRRHQKIIEEAPSGVPAKIKKQMKEAVLALCQLVKYQGAGTVEFLYHNEHFYFLEMNTRIQVEHTVTEMIFGLDLVRAQILTALKSPVFLKNQSLTPQGHSIQCRLCCEDNRFLPTGGKLLSCVWPSGFGKRVDTGFGQGDTISLNYDSLIAKVITWDTSRIRAIEKMRHALEETIVLGCTLNMPFLRHILHLPEFVEDKITIDFVEKTYPKGLKSIPLPFEEDFLMEVYKETEETPSHQFSQTRQIPVFNPWSDFLKGHK